MSVVNAKHSEYFFCVSTNNGYTTEKKIEKERKGARKEGKKKGILEGVL